MKPLAAAPSLTEQVHRALLDSVASGQLAPGSRIIQEQVAADLGVSRQPVQQALALLRSQGVLTDAPGRGLLVTPIDPVHVAHMYEVRAVIEGLAFRKAAEHGAAVAARKGPALIRAGRKAVQRKSVSELIAADMAFHGFIYALSGNPLISPAMDTHWTTAQRVMGAVLMRDPKPRDIWAEHEALLAAVVAGDGVEAEKLARAHILEAAKFMIERMGESDSGAKA